MPYGANRKYPAPRSSRLPKVLGLSNRGTHNQSTDPSGATSAPVWQFDRNAYSAIGGNGELDRPVIGCLPRPCSGISVCSVNSDGRRHGSGGCRGCPGGVVAAVDGARDGRMGLDRDWRPAAGHRVNRLNARRPASDGSGRVFRDRRCRSPVMPGASVPISSSTSALDPPDSTGQTAQFVQTFYHHDRMTCYSWRARIAAPRRCAVRRRQVPGRMGRIGRHGRRNSSFPAVAACAVDVDALIDPRPPN